VSAGAPEPAAERWHGLDGPEALRVLGSGPGGLGDAEAAERLARHGPNRLAPPPPPSRLAILVRQFRSPLIYILLAAAGLALALRERTDAAFIGAVLLLNAAIGFANEYRAERQVHALHRLVRTRARVRRAGRVVDVDAEEVVPGDLVLVESGTRVPADLRLLELHALRADESLLTGEALPVEKDAGLVLAAETPLADRRNLLFAGTFVVSGRGLGLVVATGEGTEVGAIAGVLAGIHREPPPLLRRMQRFARAIGAAVVLLSGVLVAMGLARSEPLGEVLLGAVALAVSAVPEGLPVALTVALAVAVSRMARRRVVVRHLPAVEALGSCGVIATDKTGTLTCNELTAQRVLAGSLDGRVTGVGYAPEGEVLWEERPVAAADHPRLARLLRAASLANEAGLSRRADGEVEASGDPTDVALLALAMKAGLDPAALRRAHELRDALPFEPERRYAATLHEGGGGGLVCVKGAPEAVLAMCDAELDEASAAPRPLDREAALARIEELMREGYRVIAVADGEAPPAAGLRDEPRGLAFLGLVGMTDPPREGVSQAIEDCRRAGVRVVMVTGDHPVTASAVAARIGLGEGSVPPISGPEIQSRDDEALAHRVAHHDVVARATPRDKLRVVAAWQARGALVAVTGDGVNDAPALRRADLGVAMGRGGTDVAREAADLVLTDDDFSSIVAGIEEGRVAYDNVRKVIYLLVSTGAGEVLLVLLAVGLALPVPFTPVQLLWLNLVTNGIQDVALAFEPGEPGVLRRPPRPPHERIFERLMLERTLLAGAIFAGVGIACWIQWLGAGLPVAEARSLMVQLFVLFEIFHIGNARSERTSAFRLSPFANRFLLGGTLCALAVHLAALHLPATRALLGLTPPQPREWLVLVALASSILLAMELHKLAVRRRRLPGA
jgi:P-type Ca2+ transporter type 2C